MASAFNYYGTAEDGYSAHHRHSSDSVKVRKGSDGQWTGSFHGRPRHQVTGLRCGTGTCPRIEAEGRFKTREQAAQEALRQYGVEQAQPYGT